MVSRRRVCVAAPDALPRTRRGRLRSESYSDRSAISGSRLAARRAGITLAKSAAATSTPTATTKTRGSFVSILKRKALAAIGFKQDLAVLRRARSSDKWDIELRRDRSLVSCRRQDLPIPFRRVIVDRSITSSRDASLGLQGPRGVDAHRAHGRHPHGDDGDHPHEHRDRHERGRIRCRYAIQHGRRRPPEQAGQD